jgi:ATP/maltotriose-dependent transcriptional regulator MalT
VRALLDAAREIHTPQARIRLGREWIKTASGNVACDVEPAQLLIRDALRWVRRRAWEITEQAILADDAPWPRRRLSARDRRSLGLEAMSAYRPTPPRVLRRGPTRRERELLALLKAGASMSDITTRLGVAPSTVRVLKHRLKQKGLVRNL